MPEESKADSATEEEERSVSTAGSRRQRGRTTGQATAAFQKKRNAWTAYNSKYRVFDRQNTKVQELKT
jgi:hypothetical protein